MHQPRRKANTFEVHLTLHHVDDHVDDQSDFVTKDFSP